MGNLSQFVKKENPWWKSFFSDNVEWSSKNFWKIVHGYVEANLKQQEVKYLVAVSYNFFLEIPSILEIGM